MPQDSNICTCSGICRQFIRKHLNDAFPNSYGWAKISRILRQPDIRLLTTCAGHITREAVYVYPNNEARSCNNCCDGKAISMTYSEWVFVSLRYPACNAHAPRHLWTARLYGSFLPYLINGKIFEKKKLLNKNCMFWFSLQLFSETFFILRRNEIQ